MRKYIHLSNLGYVEIKGKYPHFEIKLKDEEFREATPNENKLIESEFLAEKWVETDILCCQSSLVDELLKMERPLDGFSYDDVENLYVDPEEWTLEECKEWIDGHLGIDNEDYPDPNPWGMDREALLEYLNREEEDFAERVDDEMLRIEVIGKIDLDEDFNLWKDFIRDNQEPQEVLEWWLVTGWLCQKLREAGEPVLDNNWGFWWGRTCSGQAILADGVLQRIALTIL